MTLLIFATHHSNERKHGLYPTVVGYHDQLGIDYFLHLVGNTGDIGPYAETNARTLKRYKSGALPIPKLDEFFIASFRFRRDLSVIRNHVAEVGKPELILALTSSPIAGTLAYLAAREHNIPYIIWEHLTHYQRKTLHGLRLKRRTKVLTSAERVLAVSESLAQSLQSTIGLRAEKVSVMPNPIPTDLLKVLPPVSERYLRLSRKSFTFGAWTNWRSIKRLDLLLTAFFTVRLDHPDARLIIAGPIAENVRRKINPDHLHQNGMELLSAIPRDEIRDLARIVDCCVIPSDHETFGLPALEAMAMGRPVITTRCGGPEHLLTQATGLVVEKNSAPALASAMKQMIRNHGNYNTSNIAKAAELEYGQKAIIAHWQELYRQLNDNLLDSGQ